ncbi:MAG TPA: hypothetical protein VE987_19930 [Polyangiaceae bacterium]|nr:hypothetical protein [Polyangiaceae bacterium]
MLDDPLSLPARASVTATTWVLVAASRRALFKGSPSRGSRATVALLYSAWLVSTAFSYVPALVRTLGAVFPVGLALGMTAALASLWSPAARRAFDSLDDGEVRALLSFRAIYGALLVALASIGHFPVSFGLAAGLGDLVIGWAALAMPVRLGADGPPWARLVVHGAGLVDLAMVLVMATTVVRPWSLAHGNAATTTALPWVAVPLMFALNAHGVRRAARAFAEAVGGGSQPARRVRGAVP